MIIVVVVVVNFHPDATVGREFKKKIKRGKNSHVL
jgi:hypothetical protein